MHGKRSFYKGPSSLVHLCCLALRRGTPCRYLRLGTILSIPEANIAQKVLEICIDMSVIVIKMKETFADGCYVRMIACGYHLAKREFLFGQYAGLRQKNISSKIKWIHSIKIRGILHSPS